MGVILGTQRLGFRPHLQALRKPEAIIHREMPKEKLGKQEAQW